MLQTHSDLGGHIDALPVIKDEKLDDNCRLLIPQPHQNQLQLSSHILGPQTEIKTQSTPYMVDVRSADGTFIKLLDQPELGKALGGEMYKVR